MWILPELVSFGRAASTPVNLLCSLKDYFKNKYLADRHLPLCLYLGKALGYLC